MKIIKEGRIPYQTEVYRVVCEKCQTEFEVAEYECNWDFTGKSFDIDCPLCGWLISKELSD